MQSQRLPRFERAANVAAIELTERDHEIIRLVYWHRFVRTSDIVALIRGTAQPLLRRLQLLYHHGYLERPRAQIDYYDRGGTRPMVYALANKGAVLLKSTPGFSSQLNWSVKNRSVGRIFLEHALSVSDVMVALQLACRRRADIRLLPNNELSLPKEFSQGQPFKWRVNLSNRIKLGVIPDRVFALDYTDRSGMTERAFFFLEADRGTMPVMRKTLSQTSFYRKLLAYQATWSQSLLRTRFGFNRFRVLTVTKSPERMHSLVNACSRLKSGHGLFLFTDEKSFKNCGDIFSLEWRTGRPGETTTLLN